MKVGDIVTCKNRGKAVIIDMCISNSIATILFLKVGMYNPEVVLLKELEVNNEN